MMKAKTPARLNGDRLRAELAAAGVDIPWDGIVVRGDDLTLDVPPGRESQARRVIDRHRGEDSAPHLSVEERLARIERALGLPEGTE